MRRSHRATIEHEKQAKLRNLRKERFTKTSSKLLNENIVEAIKTHQLFSENIIYVHLTSLERKRDLSFVDS